jgi:hypothetical protein
MRGIRLKGYRINKAGKVVPDERRLWVSERLKQRGSAYSAVRQALFHVSAGRARAFATGLCRACLEIGLEPLPVLHLPAQSCSR